MNRILSFRLPFALTMAPICLLMSVSGPLRAQVAVKMISPPARTLVRPGESINVGVNVAGGQAIAVVVGSDLTGLAFAFGPPYQLTLTVPSKIKRFGPLALTAGAVMGPGHIEDSDPVTVLVERPDKPVSIRIEEKSLEFDKPGQTQSLLVWATYADGLTADITRSSLTTYAVQQSNSAPVISVSNSGQVTSLAVGSGRVIVDGICSIPVTVSPPVNLVPNRWQLYPGQQQRFYAHVNPALNLGNGVGWSLSPSVGTIDATGVYTAPDTFDPNNKFVQITAASNTDPSQMGSSYLTLLPPVVLLTPSGIAFGEQAPLTPSNPLVVTVTNSQQATMMTFDGVAITGDNPGDFTQTAMSCGTRLAPLASCTISVQFVPQATGTRSATLRISDDTGVQSVALTGSGVE